MTFCLELPSKRKEHTYLNVSDNEDKVCFNIISRKYGVIKKKLTAQIVDRRDAILTMNPNNMTCNLNRIESEFLPIQGTYAR